MSHFEFFAELYSLYYDKDDPKQGNIPKEIANWMDQNVGIAPNVMPSPQLEPVKKSFDWIKRPE